MLVPMKGVEAMTNEVLRLINDNKLHSLVRNRVDEFLDIKQMDTEKWFEELTYCLLTAYSSARMGQLCVDALCDSDILLHGKLDQIEEILKNQGHRFPQKRAEYIFNARLYTPILKKTIQNFTDIKNAREWLAKNIKGLGWKESSHFLRNVGYLEVAIIDRHIISNMVEYGILEERPKSITKRKYLDYERILDEVARKVGITLGEMDLYLWYRKTGKVLK